MQEVKDIISMYKDATSDQEKQNFFIKQQELITTLLRDNKKLQAEIEHLKILLSQDDNVEKIILTPEECLLEHQIKLLQEKGLSRELTLEETKKLDLFIKNKRLAKEQSTVISGEVKKIEKPDKYKLLELASSKPKDNG